MYAQATFEIEGTRPTLMNNGQLANPLNETAKAIKKISAKKKKTDDDYQALSRLEFEGSLYLDKDGRPCWPAANIQSGIIAAARKLRKGKEFEAAILVEDDSTLDYPGPKDVDGMYGDGNTAFVDLRNVRIRGVTIMRTRPKFDQWKLIFTVHFFEDIINFEDLSQVVEIFGRLIGLSDFRPRYGRFHVVSATNGKS